MIEELLKEIRRVSEALLTDGMLQNERGNKAAGCRARKASLELERRQRPSARQASKLIKRKSSKSRINSK